MIGLNALSSKSANGFANRAELVATTAIPPVVAATCGAGKYCAVHGISS
tara:strand:+ start:704 stop:850 length:147 start_codon:yes stop_codon:yes gene_type:complete